MKQLNLVVLALIMLVSVVAATETTLTEDTISMGYEDSRIVQFCMFNNEQPVNIGIVINPVCKELDDVFGCSQGDEFDPEGFEVYASESTTGADGCANITIITNLGENDGGVFHYTVNGYNGYSVVGAETGSVSVPEFGVLAAIGILGLVGLFIAKRRN